MSTHATPTTGQVYAEYDRLIRRIEEWLSTKALHLAGCEDAHVRARIVQRIIEITSKELTHTLSSASAADRQKLLAEFVIAGGLQIGNTTGSVRVLFGQWLSNLLHFVVEWLRLSMALFSGLIVNKSPKSSSVTLLMEDPVSDAQQMEEFFEFCKSGPIGPLSTANHLIIGNAR